LLLCGIDPLTELGPLLYAGPVAGFVILGTRLDETGLMRLIGWWDAVRAWVPNRRRVIGNPLLQLTRNDPPALRIAVHVELLPDEELGASGGRS
jgi:hypothetical protein